MSNSKQEKVVSEYVYDFECEDMFYSDLWEYFKSESMIKQINSRKYFKERFHNNCLDFSTIVNESIKNELKYYLASHVNDEKPFSPLYTYYYHTKKMISFFSEKAYKEVTHITNIPYEGLMNDWNKWLFEHNYITTTPHYYINANIEKIKKEKKADVFYVMKQFYDFYLRTKEEFCFNDDVWYFDRMPINVDIPVTGQIKSCSFEKIQQPQIKYVVKKYIYFLLTAHPCRTVLLRLSCAKNISKYLLENEPNVTCIKDINYNVVENYITWLRTRSGYSVKNIRAHRKALQEIIDYNYKNKWELVDEYLLLPELKLKVKEKEARPYSGEELETINTALRSLPIQIARIIGVIQFLPMRISDICKMKLHNYRTDEKNTKYLVYSQQKTSRNNLLVCEGIVCELIEAAIETSKQYAHGTPKYIFSDENGKMIVPSRINYFLKKMAFENNLLDKEGRPFNITTHRFRMTVATDYAQLGLEPDVIARLLGHSNLKSLNSYVAIHNPEYAKIMSPIIEMQDNRIKNIGKSGGELVVLSKNFELGIPLPNGTCYKPSAEGKCKHANVCYECRMFKADKRYIDLYKYHLKLARNNLIIARDNNYERLIQINSDLVIALENIISKIEEES